MDNKYIAFGEVSRKVCFGLFHRWKPLRLAWKACCSHFWIQSKRDFEWIDVSKEIIASVLQQGGRVLIVDRRSTSGESLDSDEHMRALMAGFGGRSIHMLSRFEDPMFIHRFVDAGSAIDDDMRLSYIPPAAALADADAGEPSVFRYIVHGVQCRLGSKVDQMENIDPSFEPPSFDNLVPVLILTIGSSWYDHAPVFASQLRAVSVASFHVLTPHDVLHPNIAANSRGFMFFSMMMHPDDKHVYGVTEFSELHPKQYGGSQQVAAYFRMASQKTASQCPEATSYGIPVFSGARTLISNAFGELSWTRRILRALRIVLIVASVLMCLGNLLLPDAVFRSPAMVLGLLGAFIVLLIELAEVAFRDPMDQSRQSAARTCSKIAEK